MAGKGKNGAYDLLILGGGSGAFSAAIHASELGKTAAMIERGTIGGTCVNVGCVPSKQLLVTGETYRTAQSNPFKGLHCEGETLDFSRAIEQKETIVRALRQRKYEHVLEEWDGVDYVEGTGTFASPHEIKVNGERLRGDSLLIATGSHPWVPPIPGLERTGYWTNVEGLSPEEQPDSLLVIGARAQGLEFAQMYAMLDTEVTLLQRSERIIPNEEPEASEALTSALEEDGVQISTQAQPTEVRADAGKKVVSAKIAGTTKEFRVDEILMATGRRPNTAELGLEKIGVELGGHGELIVDREMRTSVPHIYGAGDVRGGENLETTAAKEGYIVAENALAGGNLKMDPPEKVPRAIFTNPQFAAIGYTEEEYSALRGMCACRTLPLDLVSKPAIVGDTRGMIKMGIDPETRVVVGAQIVSAQAADLIHEAALAVKHGLTIDDIIDVVHVYPTHSEMVKLVALSFYRDVSKMSCCTQ